jgi:hypothetical protein
MHALHARPPIVGLQRYKAKTQLEQDKNIMDMLGM